jgi:hypothetical protein
VSGRSWVEKSWVLINEDIDAYLHISLQDGTCKQVTIHKSEYVRENLYGFYKYFNNT